MGPHPGIPGLPGLGPGAGIPVPTSASAALLGLGIPPGAAATPGGTAAHPLSMLSKPDIHRAQPDDLKSNGGKSRDRFVFFFFFPSLPRRRGEGARDLYSAFFLFRSKSSEISGGKGEKKISAASFDK